MPEREFPKKCSTCRQRAVVLSAVDYSTPVEHDGRLSTVTLPALLVPRYGKCGTIVLDEEANRKISAAFRKEAGLLTPEEIRQHRTALGLTQQARADLLGVAVSTLSRWKTGSQIQQRSLDRFLQSFFTFPQLRAGLAENCWPKAGVG